MNWSNIIIMAIGLAMDCFAISAVQGLNQHKWHPKALLMAAIFGFFHMSMPVVGYFAGNLFVCFMRTYAPWIALVLLIANVLLQNRKNPWLAKQNFFKLREKKQQ